MLTGIRSRPIAFSNERERRGQLTHRIISLDGQISIFSPIEINLLLSHVLPVPKSGVLPDHLIRQRTFDPMVGYRNVCGL
jgi:hypothetical protein